MRSARSARRLLRLVLSVTLLSTLAAGPAQARWSADGAGPATARAVTMPAGQAPVAIAGGSDVTVRWPVATMPDGAAVEGYRIERLDANGNIVPVAAACAGTITSTTCVEHGVPAGTWRYADTPFEGNWAGAVSSSSAPVTVAAG